jgi:hypothetical protein
MAFGPPQAAAPAGPPPGPVGPPPPVGPPQGGPGAGGSAVIDHLRQAIDHAQAALNAEPDDVDSQNLAKIVQGLYAILAGRQKEQESAMGMTPALKLLSRGA